jgi:hypothetical protein
MILTLADKCEEARDWARLNMCRQDKSKKGRAKKPKDFAKWLSNVLLKDYLEEEKKKATQDEADDSSSDDDMEEAQSRGKHRRQPGAPISSRTAQRYLHFLGFEYVPQGTGQYFDRHDDPDNVEERHKFVRRIQELEDGGEDFMLVHQSPSEDRLVAWAAEDAERKSQQRSPMKRYVLLYQDECATNCNDAGFGEWVQDKALAKPKPDAGTLRSSSEGGQRHLAMVHAYSPSRPQPKSQGNGQRRARRT